MVNLNNYLVSKNLTNKFFFCLSCQNGGREIKRDVDSLVLNNTFPP